MQDEIARIRDAALHSVGRGCLFALLAIGMTMFGLIGWPVLAFRSGAILTMLLCAILTLRAEWTRRQDFRRTETWLLLRQRCALPAERQPAAVMAALREVYQRFAIYSAAISLLCWSLAFAAWMLQTPRALT